MNGMTTTKTSGPARNADAWLLRLLTSRGILKEEDARAVAAGSNGFLSAELLRRRMVSKSQLGDAVTSHYGIPFVDPASGCVDKMAAGLVPEKLCVQHMMVPLSMTGETIDLLMANPIDPAALDAVTAVSGRRAMARFGLPERIEELIAEAYGADAVLYDLLRKLPEEATVQCLGAEDEEAPSGPSEVALPVMRLANYLIAHAVRLGASDIHVEHDERLTTVRYRIDGELRAMLKLPRAVGDGPLVSRIKIMAELDVADRRRPQDGRAKLLVGSEEVGLRVSTIPTSFGEKAVLRILDARSAQVGLDELGFRPALREKLEALCRREQGMVLLTGPTGSGKTTTLYALLNKLKGDSINIVTVEDPIEYRLEGINQVQVNEKAGLTFANVLRSVLRQDPDVLLVGEIRDRETADIAFQAALTGHLVFSTLHTNDAVASVSRLLDMGVERFKLAPGLLGVVAQRLVRRLCPSCREKTSVEPRWAQRLAAAGLPVAQHRGKGCEACAFTGYKGRVAVTELLDLRETAARERVDRAAPGLREEALAAGWLSPFCDDALWHLAQGDIAAEDAAVFLDADAKGPAGAVAVPAVKRAKRVLVVDDNPDNRAVLAASLSAEGYELSEAEDGAQAIESIARSRPDLVLLDLMMPNVDGVSVLRKVRGEMAMTDLPVIVVTAMSEAESQAQALEVGADDYMTKPFMPALLRARVKALFRRAEAR